MNDDPSEGSDGRENRVVSDNEKVGVGNDNAAVDDEHPVRNDQAMGNEENAVYEMVNEAYLDAVFILLPHMMGVKHWETMGRECQGDFEKMVSRSDEALLMWAMDCYWNVVAVNDWVQYDDDLRPDKAPYYISETGLTKKNMGWTQRGKTKYNEYYIMVDRNREDDYWYKNQWRTCFKNRWEAVHRRGRKSGEVENEPEEEEEQIMTSLDDL